MQPAVLVKLRPAGPWRSGPGDGGQNRVDALFRSDRLFSAFTIAAQQLGWVTEWLDATARSPAPALQLSSLFPFQGDTLFVTPPATLWPPPSWMVTSPSPVFLSKVRWAVARLAPAALIESILLGQKILADQWVADSESACLLRRDRPSTTPFRTVLRIAAAVDRASGRSTLAHPIACVEFEPGAGLWFVLRFRDQNSSAAWGERLRAMLRLLGDTGFGGRRSAGWGQTQAPEIQDGQWPHVLFPKLARLPRTDTASSLHWLLSLFSPSPDDAIDWTNGEYTLLERGAELGKRARFVAEGSVLAAATSPVGMAVDVGNGVGNGRAHPVYRSGMALSLPLPVITPEETLPEETPEAELEPEITLPDAVEQPADSEEPPAEPCAVIEEEPEPEPAPIREPEPEPEPITDPEPEPGPITEPEPRQSEADPRTEEKDAL